MRYSLIFFSVILIFTSCSQDIITPERVINTPVSITATSYKNGIKVSFFGNNKEEGFQGYNVYINTSPDIKNQNLSPVKNANNSYPTFPYYYTGCYYDGSAKSSIVLYKDSTGMTISNHKTYYLAVKAVAVIGNKDYESDFSSEVSVYVLKYTNFILYNNNITGQSNDSFIFNTFSIIDAPDGSVGGADAVFKLVSINNKILPSIIVNDNIGVEDIGYFSDIYADIDEVGDPNNINTTNIVEQNHLYLIKKDDKIYRLYVKKVVDSADSLTENINIELGFGY